MKLGLAAAIVLAKLAMCNPVAQLGKEPEHPEDPHAVDGNIKGSSMCRTITHDECNRAIEYFADAQRYGEHTTIAVGYRHGVVIDNRAMWHTGCKAEFYCENEEDYATGVTGKGIKDA